MSGYDVDAQIDAEPMPDQIGDSPFTAEQLHALRSQLDPKRVRQRQRFSYIATHDAKRTANAIFGFGNWGHRVVELVELAAVEVEQIDNGNPTGRSGWSVGYRCTVELTVRGCVPTSGVGYGDGIEYTGPIARHKACELAVKEAESDALKRALVSFGDQWGLILYAKQDERQRIERDLNAETARSRPEVRRNTNETRPPRGWAEIGDALNRYDGIDWRAWMVEAAGAYFKVDLPDGISVKDTLTRLDGAQTQQFGQRMATVVTQLWEKHDPALFPPLTADEIRPAFAFAFDGLALTGPVEVEKPLEEVDPDAAAIPFGAAAETS